MISVETIPLILGVLVGLVGLAILADAWLPEEMPLIGERRRRARTERSTGGEACIGLGVLCAAAAIIGRDSWDYSIVAVIAGTVLFVIGAWMNRTFFRDRITNRGALRRGGGTRAHRAKGGRDKIR
ncbi:MAG: hypothetical protein JWL60_842 [Gemmatimonadetes bacterium]|jgi:hypothetical protein|nr:hypothetical protein [Gemmatimonadota bacterium]